MLNVKIIGTPRNDEMRTVTKLQFSSLSVIQKTYRLVIKNIISSWSFVCMGNRDGQISISLLSVHGTFV